MGANQSNSSDLFEDEETFSDALGAPAESLKKRPKLYKHTGGLGPSNRWVPCGSFASWKFAQIGSNEDREDSEEDAWKDTIEQGTSEPNDWFLVVGDEVAAKVDDNLRLRLNDDQMRADFVSKGVWAIRFFVAQEYKSFVGQYQDSRFENLYGMEATEGNKLKVLGKDFVGWAAGEEPTDSMWDAEENIEASEKLKAVNVKETFRGTPTGKGAQSLTLGALANSYLIHESGIDVFRNRTNGLESEGYSIRLPEGLTSPAVTPTKGMLMRAEANMMLMSPMQGPGTPAGVRQLDLETGKIVASWQFQKDGTPISMRDISNDTKEAQLDPGQATFLGLDDNRLCRWDMRDRQGIVQEVSSPVLTWAEGHQFSRGTGFTCFASTGDGAIAVGSRDGKVRLYSTTSMRMAKTAFPGLGSPISYIDVTYDGRWVLATCDSYLLVISTMFRDKDGREKTGFQGRMGSNIAAPRLLKLNPLDAHAAGPHARFQGAHFSWVTEDGRQERNIVASVGQYSVIWNFRRVKQSEHQCYRLQEGLKSCYCYKVVLRENDIVDSRFMHDNFLGTASPEAPLVVATPDDVTSFNV